MSDKNETHPIRRVGWKKSCSLPTHTATDTYNSTWRR